MRAVVKVARLILVRVWLPAVLVIAWWFASSGSRDVYFPPLQQIVETLRRDWIWAGVSTNLVPSAIRFTIGFFLACVLGVGLGVWLGFSPRLRMALTPLLNFIRSVPAPALLPIGLLLFGISSRMNVAVIVAGAIWPTLLSASAGIQALTPELRNYSRSYRLTPRQRLFDVALPNAGPQIFAGMRTTLQISIVLIVVSEMVAAVNGVGFYVLNSQQTFAIPETWAGTLVLGLVGFGTSLLFVLVERRVLSWHFGLQRSGGDT